MGATRQVVTADVAAEVQPVSRADKRVLPVPGALAPLLPHRGLRRGSTMVVANSAGLLLALLGPASAAGAHLAVVDRPDLGMLAAAEAGVALSRCYLVATGAATGRWPRVVATLLDALDLVVVQPPRRLSPAMAQRLSARAQAAGGVLLATGPWPGAELVLAVAGSRWYGLERGGRGYLRARRTEVVTTGRRAAGQERRAWVWLPGHDGRVATAGDAGA